MSNTPTIYTVESGEADFPYIKIDDFTSDELDNARLTGGQIGQIWRIQNARKELAGGCVDLADFRAIVPTPTHVIALRNDVASNPLIADFFGDPGEFIPLTVENVNFVLYNPTRFINAAQPTNERKTFPPLSQARLPQKGFFRIPLYGWIYYAEPATGGLKKYFDTSGMIGLRFQKQTVVDE